jgi:hypothetical protein
MKSEMTNDEIEDLLQRAHDSFPGSDFVASVEDWYLEHDFITEGQEEALNKIADR